jgi:hypothetical protein
MAKRVKKMKKKKKASWQIFQWHHLVYPEEGEEKVVLVTRTEHYFLGNIERYAKAHGLTEGFVKSIRFYFRKYGENKRSVK